MGITETEIDNKLGTVLRQLRLKRNMTQEELCKSDNPSERICSTKQLRRIEKGQCEPSPLILNRLLAALGITTLEFIHLVDNQDMIHFQNDFSIIWDLFFENKYKEANLLLTELKTKPYCNMESPVVKQSMLLCNGFMLWDAEKNEECLNILHEALCITSPFLLKNNSLNHEVIADNPLALTEYRILKLIAITMHHMGQLETKIIILDSMCESLQNKKIDVEIRNRLLPNIYYNLSDALIEDNNYQSAFLICEKGIKLCKQTKSFKMLPYLLYNKAESLLFIDTRARAIKGFKQSHKTFLLYGDEKTAAHVKEVIAGKYQIPI
jgi:transcriptional regulator with XRE-family HTH domain